MDKLTVAMVASMILATSAGYIGHQEESHGDEGGQKDYNFQYSVQDSHHKDYKSHQETSHGGVVKGYYSVKDADGSLREVHYTADKKNGFQAIVTKDGVQVHPHTGGSEQHDSGQESHYQDDISGHDLGHQEYSGHDLGHQEFSGHDLGHQEFSAHDIGYQQFSGHDLGHQEFSGHDLGHQEFSGHDLGHQEYSGHSSQLDLSHDNLLQHY